MGGAGARWFEAARLSAMALKQKEILEMPHMASSSTYMAIISSSLSDIACKKLLGEPDKEFGET